LSLDPLSLTRELVAALVLYVTKVLNEMTVTVFNGAYFPRSVRK
jgi:hypothetical protein